MIATFVYVALVHISIGYMYMLAVERKAEQNMAWWGQLFWVLGWPLILPVTMVSDQIAARRFRKQEAQIMAAIEKAIEEAEAAKPATDHTVANARNTTVN